MLDGWRPDAITLTVGEPFGTGTPDKMQAYAAEVLRRLSPRAPLVSFSLGGLLALKLMAQAPERFERLALICAGAGPETSEGAAARREGEAAALAEGVEAHLRYDLLPHVGLCKTDGTIPATRVDMARMLRLAAYRR